MTLRNLPRGNTSPPRRIAVRVTPAAERAVRSGHPWVYDEAIQRQSHHGEVGDLAVIYDRKDRFLAVGLYDPGSAVRIRILQNQVPAPINSEWFAHRIEKAAKIRNSIELTNTNAYRLVHGENDGLPGLVIDRYADVFVLKLYSSAWIPHLAEVIDGIERQMRVDRIVLRLAELVRNDASRKDELIDGMVLVGNPLTSPVSFSENGILFEADVIQGQKTGFFLDQRDNRLMVGNLASGKSVLNVFAYTGGFSLYAARGGATAVISLDLNKPALKMAKHHFEINNNLSGVAAARHEILQGDAFQLLEQLGGQGSMFDLIVLDPPSFAMRKEAISGALAAYKRLNQLGIRLLEPGGILVSASCSSRVSAGDFFKTIEMAAEMENRELTILERTGHPIDHPINFKEGAYLKCQFSTVG